MIRTIADSIEAGKQKVKVEEFESAPAEETQPAAEEPQAAAEEPQAAAESPSRLRGAPSSRGDRRGPSEVAAPEEAEEAPAEESREAPAKEEAAPKEEVPAE